METFRFSCRLVRDGLLRVPMMNPHNRTHGSASTGPRHTRFDFRSVLHREVAEAFLDAADLIGKTLEPEQAIGGILRLLSERLHLEKGRVVLPEGDSGMLRIRYAHDLTEDEQARGVYALGEGLTGRIMTEGSIALVPDISQEPEYLAHILNRTRTHSGEIAFIAVPIMQDEKPIGVLAVNPAGGDSADFHVGLYVLQVMASMIGQILRINSLVTKKTRDLMSENRALKNARYMDEASYGILGKSHALQQAQQSALRAASSQATVMLVGESGTGKEKFARLIHFSGVRRGKPFICINCATIPKNLLESELFGHEKGSFTGATGTHTGKFELASGGTLFLDEIGDMDIELQAKLLRTLQERTIQRIGGQGDIPVDVRIITATHKNLQDLVNHGEFRLDLYYRLNVIPINLPALRDRKGDIRLLAIYFLNRENHRYGRNIILHEDALALLEQYDWPGNIRQLENVMERTVIMTVRDRVTTAEIEKLLTEEARVNAAAEPQQLPAAGSGRPYARVREHERESILDALRRSGGNKTQAAKQLGLTARQLHYRLGKLEIDA